MSDEDAMAAAMQGLSHACYTFWPELVIFVSAFFTTAPYLQLIRSRNHPIVMLHTESPYQDEEQMMRGQFADVNLLNDPINITKWRELGRLAEYMPHAYNPDVHFRRAGEPHPDYKSDFGWIGTIFESRRQFFEGMLSAGGFDGVDVTLGGSGWDSYPDTPLLQYLAHRPDECVPNDETAKVYQNSRVGINFYRREGEVVHQGEGWSMGPREVEMAACGLPFLRDKRGESDEIFPFLPTFETPEEAADKLKWLLSHENERLKLADQAFYAIKDRTFLKNATWLMDYLDQNGIVG